MMLPATVARFWARSLPGLMLVAILVAMLSGFIGLIVSYHLGVASGPSIVLTASTLYIFSLIFSPQGVVRRLFPKPHLSR
jgi:zinc/manganese transport system permease protein